LTAERAARENVIVTTPLRIGIDFDNTIVCYDQVFHRVALERSLIPASLPVSKSSVRDHLRATGNEDAWTQMQGYVYGARMIDAPAFPGAIDFFRRAVRTGVHLSIVSHKTRHPYLGAAYDLHQAALDWLQKNGFFDTADIGLHRGQVFLEQHKHEKLLRIRSLACTHFIDDLPELLAEPGFPRQVRRFLFDPRDEYSAVTEFRRIGSWSELTKELLGA
jgi:hypothetical protein